MKIKKRKFGVLEDGTAVDVYTLENESGMKADVTNYGGIIISLWTPDRNGEMGDVVLGYDNLVSYEKMNPFFGCLVGRYGNRIANGEFTLDSKNYQLAKNDGHNHLHGGLKGFDKQVWQAKAREMDDGPGLVLKYTSPDGEEGYPGTLSVKVVYTLTNEDALKIDYSASTDKRTVVNLTNHSYFNLSAGKADTILDHSMMLNADYFTPVDGTLIPTGEIQSVANTPLDFRSPTIIGARINESDAQLKFGGGYDHNWIVNGEPGQLRLAAKVYEESSGRLMKVMTTEPAIQFYAGNMLPSIQGKAGRTYEKRAALCLETQHYPDSPNKAAFPSTVLNPGDTFTSTTIYKFKTK
jgi:aldose 1-epimerase